MKVSWTEYKDFVDSRKLHVNFIETDHYYHIVSRDDFFELCVELDKTPSDTTDLDDFVDNYKAKANKPITKMAYAQGVPQVSVRHAEGSSTTKVTHDWCNPSTWYQNSTEITGETLTDSGDGLTFNSTKTYWIDLSHGKIYGENAWAASYAPAIYDNAVVVTTGFTINYEAGTVTFDSAPTGPVTADYFYGQDSTWTMSPEAGKVLLIEHAELQFTKDTQITAPINFGIYVYHPDQVTYPGLKVAYQVITYKNMRDMINAANLGTGFIPAIGELTNDVIVFPFNYATVKPLTSSIGLELRLWTDGHAKLEGEWGTAAFYVLSEDE